MPVSAPVDTGNSERSDTGNLGLVLANDLDLLAILANEDLTHERNQLFDPGEWRIEVYTNRNGRRYWNWRRRGKRGGRDNWAYGGTFDTLGQDRQAQYWQRAKNV